MSDVREGYFHFPSCPFFPPRPIDQISPGGEIIDDISVKYLLEREKEVSASILIEGLPGIGQVGKLVAEYMIEEIGAEKIAEIHSVYFPPQVVIDIQGVARLLNNEIYLYHGDKNILFLVGDYQSATNEGHYRLVERYLDIAQQFGVQRIFTLGGYGVGHFVDDPRVFAAVNMDRLRQEVLDSGAIFNRGEPGTGIVGASGLLLGMGIYRNMEGICLMGETSGYLVDPIGARKVLEVLCRMIGMEIDPTKLSERAEEMEQFIAQLKEEKLREYRSGEEDLVYIG